jgi:hypothetical protein
MICFIKLFEAFRAVSAVCQDFQGQPEQWERRGLWFAADLQSGQIQAELFNILL